MELSFRYTGFSDKNGKEIYEGYVLRKWCEDAVEPDGGFYAYMYVCWTNSFGWALWGKYTVLETFETNDTLRWSLENEQWEIAGDMINDYELIYG